MRGGSPPHRGYYLTSTTPFLLLGDPTVGQVRLALESTLHTAGLNVDFWLTHNRKERRVGQSKLEDADEGTAPLEGGNDSRARPLL